MQNTAIKSLTHISLSNALTEAEQVNRQMYWEEYMEDRVDTISNLTPEDELPF